MGVIIWVSNESQNGSLKLDSSQVSKLKSLLSYAYIFIFYLGFSCFVIKGAW